MSCQISISKVSVMINLQKNNAVKYADATQIMVLMVQEDDYRPFIGRKA